MLKNNIKDLLNAKEISINKLSESIGLTYKATHTLVNRNDLKSTPIGTLLDVARVLNVEITELYSEEHISGLEKGS